jgi:signal transduction histidine kinase
MPMAPPRYDVIAEVTAVTLASWLLVWAILTAGLGLLLGPILLSTCWTGLRTGRAGAWFSILLAAALVLPTTEEIDSEAILLRLHMLLACIASIGYLAGSFAEAEALSSAEIARRDRMLYQADRLRTLRAMSVAVIHEISQPLSTIAIEAKNLATQDPVAEGADMQRSAGLIARKAQDLSQLVRRLRGFGSREADEPSPICVGFFCNEILSIAQPEARPKQVSIICHEGPEVAVLGQDIELRQALLNLVRNAIAAAPAGSTVDISHEVTGSRVQIHVDNDPPQQPPEGGMGIGLIVARSIVQAHGGTIERTKVGEERVRFTTDLPTVGEDDE